MTCTWKETSDFNMGNTWSGDCDILWTMMDGTPKENEMNFCPKCGKPLVEVPFVEPQEDEEATDD